MGTENMRALSRGSGGGWKTGGARQARWSVSATRTGNGGGVGGGGGSLAAMGRRRATVVGGGGHVSFGWCVVWAGPIGSGLLDKADPTGSGNATIRLWSYGVNRTPLAKISSKYQQ